MKCSTNIGYMNLRNDGEKDDFVDDLCDKLDVLLRHDFIAKQQSNFQTEVMERLQMGEFIVLLDFAENYSFVLQDVAQGFHWTHRPQYMHLCATSSTSAVIISDCVKHDTVSVHLFQQGPRSNGASSTSSRNTSMLFQQISSISLTVLLPSTRTGRISSIFVIIEKIFWYVVVILFYIFHNIYFFKSILKTIGSLT